MDLKWLSEFATVRLDGGAAAFDAAAADARRKAAAAASEESAVTLALREISDAAWRAWPVSGG